MHQWRRPRRLRQRRENQRDGCERLPQPHLVREDASVAAEAAETVDAVVEEDQTLLLVRLHHLVQRGVQQNRRRGVARIIGEGALDHEAVGVLRVETRLLVRGAREYVGLRTRGEGMVVCVVEGEAFGGGGRGAESGCGLGRGT